MSHSTTKCEASPKSPLNVVVGVVNAAPPEGGGHDGHGSCGHGAEGGHGACHDWSPPESLKSVDPALAALLVELNCSLESRRSAQGIMGDARAALGQLLTHYENNSPSTAGARRQGEWLPLAALLAIAVAAMAYIVLLRPSPDPYGLEPGLDFAPPPPSDLGTTLAWIVLILALIGAAAVAWARARAPSRPAAASTVDYSLLARIQRLVDRGVLAPETYAQASELLAGDSLAAGLLGASSRRTGGSLLLDDNATAQAQQVVERSRAVRFANLVLDLADRYGRRTKIRYPSPTPLLESEHGGAHGNGPEHGHGAATAHGAACCEPQPATACEQPHH